MRAVRIETGTRACTADNIGDHNFPVSVQNIHFGKVSDYLCRRVWVPGISGFPGTSVVPVHSTFHNSGFWDNLGNRIIGGAGCFGRQGLIGTRCTGPGTGCSSPGCSFGRVPGSVVGLGSVGTGL